MIETLAAASGLAARAGATFPCVPPTRDKGRIEIVLEELERSIIELDAQSVRVLDTFRPACYFARPEDGDCTGAQLNVGSDLALQIRSLEARVLEIISRLKSVCDASEI